MSKYTTQLRWIVEQLGQGLEVPEGQQYADAVYKYIGLTEYPIFDENYRNILNDMIINHYFYMEIGFETAAQFSHYLKRTMREIMPKYNLMYNALEEMLENDNVLSDFARHSNEDWTAHTDNVGVSNGKLKSVGQSESSSHNQNIYNDTPMSMLNNDGDPNIHHLDYATNVTFDDTHNNASSMGNTDTDNSFDNDRDDIGNRKLDVWGRNSSFTKLMKEFYEDFKNIDLMIIDDLRDLFMGIW